MEIVRSLESTYTLSPNDMLQAGEHYLDYCSGLATLGDPEKFKDAHNYPVDEENIGLIIAYANRTMMTGLRKMIHYVQPEAMRTQAQMIGRHAASLQPLHAVMSQAYLNNRTRLNRMNTTLELLRPLPILDETVYKYVLWGKTKRIGTRRLMNGFRPADIVEAALPPDPAVLRRNGTLDLLDTLGED